MEASKARDFYAGHGTLAEPLNHAPDLDPLPADIAALCAVVQGVLIHLEWASRYDRSTDKPDLSAIIAASQVPPWRAG
jgi:hypothetical protein